MDKFYCETQLSERLSKTPEGFLVCHDVPITVAGDMYYNPDQFGGAIEAKNGHVRVAKKIEDIHSIDTIRSFEGKPITLGHPTDEFGNSIFVTPENSKELTHGTLQNVRPGTGASSKYLLADFFITDKEAIEKVESGEVRQVSCGYNYDAANIQEGFFEQTNIRGNHVALVPRGRAGPQCAIFDSKEEVKNMSLKDKVKEALSVFTKSIDEAVPDEVTKDMAIKTSNKKAVDESPMQQAVEDMTMMFLDERMSRLEMMFSDLVAKLKDIVFEKATKASEGSAADAEEEIIEKSEENKDKEEDDKSTESTPEDTPPKKQAVSYDADTIFKAEVLAPGILKTGDNLKGRALDECYKTESGKKIIDILLGEKSFDAAEVVEKEILFNAAASLLSSKRNDDMKKASAYDSSKYKEDYRSIAVINRRNEEFWHKQNTGVK